jgi:hypothetical protein
LKAVKESIPQRDNSDFNQQFLSKYKNQVSKEIFSAFCQEASLCPECLTETLTISQDESKEIVCKKCGLVVGDFLEKQHTLPGVGGDTYYNDTCSLSFGKSLGTELGKYQMYSVLAKSEAGKIDIGKRRLIIKNVMRVEIPQVQQLLYYGSQLCKEFHLDGKDDRSVMFANELGRTLRLVGSVALSLSNNTLGIKKLVKACFLYLHKKTFHNGSQLQKQLKVDDASIEWVEWILNSYTIPKGFEIRRKKIF